MMVPEEEEEQEDDSPEAALRRAQHEAQVRKKNAALVRYRDQISDLMLARQFQDADHARLSADIERLVKVVQAAGGRGGRMNAARETGEEKLSEQAKALTAKLQTFETRASDANHVNRNLEIIINELRRERAEQLALERAKEARETAMAADMRAYASAAHLALDEKERIKSRLRRMRHEWRVEKGSAEQEASVLQMACDDLDKINTQMEDNEEVHSQADKRKEARLIRDRAAMRQRLELRAGYLSSQLNGLVGEFKFLGDVAGLNSKSASLPFSAQDPASSQYLIHTMRSNEQRNESELAFLQSLDTDLGELNDEVTALLAEEKALQALNEADSKAKAQASAQAVIDDLNEAKSAERLSSVDARLVSFQPELASAVSRLYKHFETLETAPVKVLQPIAHKFVPKGLEASAGDEPVHVAIDGQLARLDALLQLMSSRVTRLSVLRQENSEQQQQSEGSASPLHAHLHMFTELPPEFTLAELKAARAELEQVTSKRKEAFEEA
uniref:Uncharacterized protein n=1 Tax=Haptolina brevifila TaxID=156173 RepID=A0A7S2ID08_9EUKA|mmetsp:Transcript_64784/g.128074  ORF Transcript_64784/g.128074 Transcript_64784/m.128074 type:complete len:501 (+) Transcript_64784:1-1503(+)